MRAANLFSSQSRMVVGFVGIQPNSGTRVPGHPWWTWGVPRPQNPDGPNSAGIGQDDVAALTVDNLVPAFLGLVMIKCLFER